MSTFSDIYEDFFKSFIPSTYLDPKLKRSVLSILQQLWETSNSLSSLDSSDVEGKKALRHLEELYSSLAKSFLAKVTLADQEKSAAIPNPLDSKEESKDNTLAKARALAKMLTPKIEPLLENLPSQRKVALLSVVKEISALLEKLRTEADRNYRNNKKAWFVVYAFTLLVENLNHIARKSLR